METLQKRFATLERRLFVENFLDEQRTIIPNFLFTYRGEQEVYVKQGVQKILMTAKEHTKKLVEVNLYDIFTTLFAEEIEDVFALAEAEGLEMLLDAVEPTLNDSDSLVEAFNNLSKDSDVVLLTGVGTAYPIIHTSGLLKRLATSGHSKPIIVFYPGTFNGTQLKLFDRYEVVEDEYQIYVIA
ncbi:DUF1788 domain-containing protein [Bacillus tropicus]|uniref:BREX protein BrxB domain-containing protein n=1 Tax=Bacillus tropicus TaxID=2026188 RepID=UPI002E1EEABD|nr:DUF1788 domain-containing protein [Bacillus tropicus]